MNQSCFAFANLVTKETRRNLGDDIRTKTIAWTEPLVAIAKSLLRLLYREDLIHYRPVDTLHDPAGPTNLNIIELGVGSKSEVHSSVAG